MIVYFISLSIMTMIELKVSYVAGSFNSGSLTIKSIVISSYSDSGTGANCICLYLACLADLFCWYWIHSLIYCSTRARSLGAVYPRPRSSIVLDTPGYPYSRLSW